MKYLRNFCYDFLLAESGREIVNTGELTARDCGDWTFEWGIGFGRVWVGLEKLLGEGERVKLVCFDGGIGDREIFKLLIIWAGEFLTVADPIVIPFE